MRGLVTHTLCFLVINRAFVALLDSTDVVGIVGANRAGERTCLSH
jgi:hypothetical protein